MPFAGTCINNTGVFMFKKGCFELGATIYPVVIKVHTHTDTLIEHSIAHAVHNSTSSQCGIVGATCSSLPTAYLKCCVLISCGNTESGNRLLCKHYLAFLHAQMSSQWGDQCCCHQYTKCRDRKTNRSLSFPVSQGVCRSVLEFAGAEHAHLYLHADDQLGHSV